MVTAAMKLTDACSLEGSDDTYRQCMGSEITLLANVPAVQGTLKSLLQHHSSKASMLRHSAFCIVQLTRPYVTTGKTIALTSRTFVGKIMSLLLNMLSRLVITFLPRSKRLLISWLQSPSVVIFEPRKIKSDTVSTISKNLSDIDDREALEHRN